MHINLQVHKKEMIKQYKNDRINMFLKIKLNKITAKTDRHVMLELHL